MRACKNVSSTAAANAFAAIKQLKILNFKKLNFKIFNLEIFDLEIFNLSIFNLSIVNKMLLLIELIMEFYDAKTKVKQH